MGAGLKRAAIALAIGIGVLGTGQAFAAAADGTSASTPAEAAKKDPSKRVCRNLTLTGSRMTTRHCRSQADWDRDQKKAQDWVQDGQLNGARRDGESNGSGAAGAPR